VSNCEKNLKVFDGYDKEYQVFSDIFYLDHQILIEGNTFFKQMDNDYPESLFIYNTRNIDNWIQSRLNHTLLERFKSVYKTESTDDVIKKWKETRLNFEDDLDGYFHNKKNFLVVDIEKELNPTLKISKSLNIDLLSDAWTCVGKTNF
jgi:hypothetical protein